MVIFHSYVTVYQRVTLTCIFYVCLLLRPGIPMDPPGIAAPTCLHCDEVPAEAMKKK